MHCAMSLTSGERSRICEELAASAPSKCCGGELKCSYCVRGVSWSEVATVPKREVAQGVGPKLLGEHWGEHLEGLEEERWNEVEDGDSRGENNQDETHKCTCMDGMTRARRTSATVRCEQYASMNGAQCAQYCVLCASMCVMLFMLFIALCSSMMLS